MILKRLLLEPVSEQGGNVEGSGAPAPASTATPPASTPAPQKTQTSRRVEKEIQRAPTEDEKKVVFSADDGMPNSSDNEEPEEKKEERKPVAEVKPAPEPAKAEPAKPAPEVKAATEEKKEVVEQLSVKSVSTASREARMASLPPEEQAILKQMSNPAFEHAMKLIERNRELESKGGSGVYYQHPQGFTLDPQFQRLQEDAQYANAEFTYWQQQLNNINEAKDWQPILGWNKDGTMRLGQPRKPTTADAEQVRLAMNDCRTAFNNNQGMMQQYVGQFQQRVQGDMVAIDAELAKRCAWVADPKQMEDKIEVQGLGERSLKQIQEDFYNIIPPYTRNTGLAKVASHLFIALQVQAAKIRELSATKQVAAIQQKEEAKVEPKSTESAPPAQQKIFNVRSPVKTFSLEGMPDMPAL